MGWRRQLLPRPPPDCCCSASLRRARLCSICIVPNLRREAFPASAPTPITAASSPAEPRTDARCRKGSQGFGAPKQRWMACVWGSSISASFCCSSSRATEELLSLPAASAKPTWLSKGASFNGDFLISCRPRPQLLCAALLWSSAHQMRSQGGLSVQRIIVRGSAFNPHLSRCACAGPPTGEIASEV